MYPWSSLQFVVDQCGTDSLPGPPSGFATLQVLLVVSGGTNVGRLPIMSLAFFLMLKTWLRSVKELATFSNCSMTHVEDTMEETFASNADGLSTDEDRFTSLPAAVS